MTAISYVDASALAKLVVHEPGSDDMLRWLVESERVASNRIGIVETFRAAQRRVHDRGHLDAVLASIEIIEFDAAIATRAAAIGPPSLRTLDAIHLASALALAVDLVAFVTYDQRLADAARSIGLPVVAPG